MSKRRMLLKSLYAATNRLFKEHWMPFAVIAGAYIVPVALLDRLLWNNSELLLKMLNRFSLPILTLIDYGIYIILVVVFFMTLAALIRAIHLADRGEPVQLAEVYSHAIRILDAYLWVKILFAWKVVCWSLLLVVPGIIFGVRYGFSGMAAAVDGKKGMEALRSSWDIIRPRLGDFLFCVITGVAIVVLLCVAYILSLDILIVFLTQKGLEALAQVTNTVEIGIVAVTGIYLLIFYYYLYKTLRDSGETA